jgi:hypothetical protein
MTYRVDRYNGTFLTNVEDGSIDTSTDLKFVGKNYTGYGQIQNENFLYLLENFANTVQPSKPVSGQIWYDSSSKKLKFYDGSKFKSASGAEIASSPPAGLSQGDLWFDTNTNQLSAWNGSSFVLIGPQSAPGFGTSQIVTQVVKDVNNTSHVILKAVVGGLTTAVFSNDPDFTLSSTNSIAGFSEAGRQIKKGVTLNSVSDTGVSDSSGYRFWGTASNSERLGGHPVEDFIRSTGGTAQQFTGADPVSFSGAGLTVGLGDLTVRKDLRIYINTANQPTIENQNNGVILFRISNAASVTDRDDMMIFSRQQYDTNDITTAKAIFPANTETINLGASSRHWKNIYAQSLFGNLTGNVTGNTTGTHTGNINNAAGTTAYNATTRSFTADNFYGQFTGSLSGQATSAVNASKLGTYDPLDIANPGVISIPIRSASGAIKAVLFDGQAKDTQTVNGRQADVNKTGDTLVIRTASGDVNGRFFNGTASSANYADLAEIYKTDKEYEVGTVMVVGGEYEVTACQDGDRAIGVISQNPAYLMNSEAEGQPVALKGRVPVKVVGPIKKGQRLVAAADGTARAATDRLDNFAIALASDDREIIKIVEAIIL